MKCLPTLIDKYFISINYKTHATSRADRGWGRGAETPPPNLLEALFGFHLEKLEVSAKICTVASSHTYSTEKVRNKRASHPPLCKFSTPFTKSWICPRHEVSTIQRNLS